MSGFPLKSPADASKYRQIYMATLGLQASNDEKNLVANQLFKKTGEVPVQPPDTRTTAQKYTDIISLKNGALGALAKIMDGDEVRRAIAQMTRGEVAFYLNYSPAINNDILSKMKLGITADTFLPYLRMYMRKEIDTAGVNYGLQQGTGDRLLLSLQQIDNDMITRDDLARLGHIVGHGFPVGGGGGAGGGGDGGGGGSPSVAGSPRGFGRFPQTIQVIYATSQLRDSLPEQRELDAMFRVASANGRQGFLNELKACYQELPTKEQLETGLQRLQLASRAGDDNAQQSALDNLIQLTTVRPEVLRSFQQMRADVRRMGAESETLSPEGVEAGYYSLAEIPRDDDDEFGSTPVATSSSALGSLGHALTGILSSGAEIFGVGGGGGVVSTTSTQPPSGLRLSGAQEIHATSGGGGGYSSTASTTAEERSPRPPTGQQLSTQLNKLAIRPREYYSERSSKQNAAIARDWVKLEEVLNQIQGLRQKDNNHFQEALAVFDPNEQGWEEFWMANDVEDIMRDLIQRRDQHNSSGKGLKRGRKPRISGTGVKPAKVAPIERYGRIGDHIIKLQPLEKNILTINTPNGWAVKGLPSKTISSNLVNVFKEIVGEGIPKYSSIEDLTEGEKDFLNKIARITKIEDRVKVKTPTKTDLDKLVNRFEILKGEICAGNNSNELVKEFKKIIMTLSNEGMLPKGQAREILMDLVSLGF